MQGRAIRNREWILSVVLITSAGFLLSTIACVAPNNNSRHVKVIGGADEPALLNRYFLKKKEREKGLPNESEWNRFGLWRKISSSPDIFVPQGYSGKAPADDSNGTWFDDQRDGKRLFVPIEQVGEYSPSLLGGDAKKVTTWRYD